MREKRRLIMLYFTRRTDLHEAITRYAERKGLSFTRAVWELVKRGLEEVGAVRASST